MKKYLLSMRQMRRQKSWYRRLMPLMSRCPAELMHHLGLTALSWFVTVFHGYARPTCPAEDPWQLKGLTFGHRVGIAAGLDKNAKHLKALSALGVSYIEVGTVTPLPQAGNPKPRLFKNLAHRAILNRMGFNNDGVEAVAARVLAFKRWQAKQIAMREAEDVDSPAPALNKQSTRQSACRCVAQRQAAPVHECSLNCVSQDPKQGCIHGPSYPQIPVRIGINIGKNASTPIERAVDDYRVCLRAVADVADYVTINISSPNTEGLRSLESLEPMRELCHALVTERDALIAGTDRTLPIMLKLSPDMSIYDLRHVCEQVNELGIDGLVLTNTTVSREGSIPEEWKTMPGGISGQPLTDSVTDMMFMLYWALPEGFPVMASGGIMSDQDAYLRRWYGATAIQLYSGLIFDGPGLIDEMRVLFKMDYVRKGIKPLRSLDAARM